MKNFSSDPKWLPGVITAVRGGPVWFTITLTDNRVVRCYDDHVRDHKDTLEPELENDDDWLSQAMR